MGDDRRFRFGLLAVFVIALACRWGFTIVVDPGVPRVGDASAYHLLAAQLADGDGYIRPFDRAETGAIRPTAEYPPLHPAVVAVADLFGVGSVRGQRLALGVVGSLGAVLVALAARRIAGGTAGVVAGLTFAVHPLVLQSDATLMPEALYATLVAAVLVLALRATDGRPRDLAVLGAAIGLAALTRAEGLLLLPLLAAPLAWRRRSWTALALAIAGTAVVVLPWTVRNAVRLDAFVPISTNVGSAVDGSNCDATYGGSQLGLWRYSPGCFDGFAQADLGARGEADVAASHRDEGLRYAKHHLGRVPAVATVRVLRTWGLWAPRQQTYVATLEGRTLAWERAGTVLHWLLLPLAAAGGILLRRRGEPAWPFVATMVAVTVTAAATYGNQRFRAGAEPAIAVLAAVALVAAAERATARFGRG
jgi:predicted membrane-bound dolichyl-phosphate-mannose-protein mannosyltransferase